MQARRQFTKWRRGIRAQLLVMIVIPFAIVGVLGAVSFGGLQRLKHDIDIANDQQLPSSVSLGAMDSSLTRIQLRLYETYTTPLIDHAGRTKATDAVKKEIREFDRAHDEFKNISKSDKQNAIYNGFVGHLENQRKYISQVVQALEKNTKSENDQAEALIQGPLTDGLSPLMEAMAALHALERESMAAAKTDVNHVFTFVSTFVTGASAVGLAALLFIGLFIVRRIANGMTDLSERLGAAEESVVHSSVELSKASSLLSDSTVRTASSVQETLSALTEVSTTVSQNSADADRARDMAEANLQTTAEGRVAVQKMFDAMDDIKAGNEGIATSVDASNTEFGEILRVIANIQQKTKVINEIVFQTRLLSFNASVEAARAGEHGRGFSVVAEEIGNLAQMSGSAATEISTLLESSVEQVRQVIDTSRTSIRKMVATGEEKVTVGETALRQCGDMFQKVLDKANGGVETNGKIARASSEQATGISLVETALHDISRTTESNRDMSHRTAQISADLSQESLRLRQMVQKLRHMVDGTGEDGPGRDVDDVDHMGETPRDRRLNSAA